MSAQAPFCGRCNTYGTAVDPAKILPLIMGENFSRIPDTNLKFMLECLQNQGLLGEKYERMQGLSTEDLRDHLSNSIRSIVRDRGLLWTCACPDGRSKNRLFAAFLCSNQKYKLQECYTSKKCVRDFLKKLMYGTTVGVGQKVYNTEQACNAFFVIPQSDFQPVYSGEVPKKFEVIRKLIVQNTITAEKGEVNHPNLGICSIILSDEIINMILKHPEWPTCRNKRAPTTTTFLKFMSDEGFKRGNGAIAHTFSGKIETRSLWYARQEGVKTDTIIAGDNFKHQVYVGPDVVVGIREFLQGRGCDLEWDELMQYTANILCRIDGLDDELSQSHTKISLGQLMPHVQDNEDLLPAGKEIPIWPPPTGKRPTSHKQHNTATRLAKTPRLIGPSRHGAHTLLRSAASSK